MKNRNFQILDGTMLKLIAMISMVFDHAGDLFFHDQLWMRMIGRLAMPLFSFCIAEGYRYTKDRKKYLLRMGLFALISEIPFDLAFTGKIDLSHQNIMLTFFLSILALMISDRIRGDGKNTRKTILCYLVILFTAVLALIVKTDYTLFAVIAVFLFHIFEEKKHWIRCTIGVAFLALTRTMSYYCTTGLSIIPLLLYNAKKGKGLKWLFYLFYPGHLLLIYLIRTFLLKSKKSRNLRDFSLESETAHRAVSRSAHMTRASHVHVTRTAVHPGTVHRSWIEHRTEHHRTTVYRITVYRIIEY